MSTDSIRIRPIEKSEVKKLQEISKFTFYETFVHDCTPSDMEKFLNDDFSLEKLSAEMENSESQFFFAESNNQIIGYLKLNSGKAQTESKLENALEIERLYVISEFQGKKIGQLLMNKALEIAKSGNFAWVWLGVWEHNMKAIHFYEKYGFVVFGSHPFMLGNDKQTDVLMKLNLV